LHKRVLHMIQKQFDFFVEVSWGDGAHCFQRAAIARSN
jgi:hypothetical protein